MCTALYHGVPPANSIGQSIMHKERLPLVQNIYEWLTEVNNQNGSTAKTYFGLLVHFSVSVMPMSIKQN